MTRLERLYIALIIFSISFNASAAEIPGKIFKTKYTTIYYAQDKDAADFIWRLGGGRIAFPADSALAANRVDRVIERVETILDMRPKNFTVNIYLHRGELGPDKAAYYDNRSKSIHISVDYTSDGVFAHEVAHAIISQYFSAIIPTKIQEILTQYVDKYLWSDY